MKFNAFTKLKQRDLVDLHTRVKNLLRGNLNGLKDFELIDVKGGWMYFAASQQTWLETVLVRVNIENFASNHQFKHLDKDKWNKLYSEQ